MKTNLLRTITTTAFLFLVVSLFFSAKASETGVLEIAENTGITEVAIGINPEADKTGAERQFLLSAKRHNIATRKVTNFKGVAEGYYIIAGVFGDMNNVKRFANKLAKQGLATKIINHPHKALNYVALSHDTDWQNAISLAAGKLGGSYSGKTWILNVSSTENVIEPIVEVRNTRPVIKPVKAEFKAHAKALGVANREVVEMAGLSSGFYVIAGVFGEVGNANRQIRKLRSKGLDAKVLSHPESGLNYVYILRDENFHAPVEACITGGGGRYDGKLWVLNVIPNISENTIGNVAENVTESVLKSKQAVLVSPKSKEAGVLNLKDPVKSKLLEKADLYFDKMWYAEAAELYEQVLNRNSKNYTFEIIQKAGDSHYFNTNMERAHHWYDILYSDFKDEMSAENLFKYAHSLKGTGKYARAKRLMRIYNKAMEREKSAPISRERANSNEMVLDNILSAEETFGVKIAGINSKYSDFAPMYYNNDELVFASAADSSFFTTRRYKWNNQPYLDLYVAKINKESDEVKNAIKFSKNINTKYHEASVTFSPDNEVMYFTRNNYGKKLKRDKYGINHLKIYMSTKIGDEWSEAVELPFNSDNYSTGHPALSPDGKQLYFVSDMPGSIGKTDIFVVDVLGDGNFSEPRNLGPEINTESREMFPFITDKKLYFSSDGHVGLGGLDVYEVAYTEDEGFLEVRNLGKPINSKLDDFSYIIDEEDQKGFFASNRKGGVGDDDIYSFRRLILEEINENAIAGVVTDIVTGEVMPEALITLLDENNMKLKEVVTGADGSFVFEDLDSNTKYTIKATKGDYVDYQDVYSTKDNELIEAQIAMQRLEELVEIEDGIRKLKIDMIYFDFDKSNIRPDAAEALEKLVGIMREYPSMVIKIESHTDSRGSSTYNRYLSNRRARSTREYLISRGINAARIESATGYGEDRLVNDCDGTIRCTAAQHQLNRRSEFIIVNM